MYASTAFLACTHPAVGEEHTGLHRFVQQGAAHGPEMALSDTKSGSAAVAVTVWSLCRFWEGCGGHTHTVYMTGVTMRGSKGRGGGRDGHLAKAFDHGVRCGTGGNPRSLVTDQLLPHVATQGTAFLSLPQRVILKHKR